MELDKLNERTEAGEKGLSDALTFGSHAVSLLSIRFGRLLHAGGRDRCLWIMSRVKPYDFGLEWPIPDRMEEFLWHHY